MDLTLIVTLALLVSPVSPRPLPVWESLTVDEAAVLRELEEVSLADLRAGAPEDTAPLDGTERAALEAAQSGALELAEQRAGDLTLTDYELKIIGITAGVVLVLVLLL